ncbi:MAG: hypothetical protein OEY64_04350 [Nitrospinota bacterium]|nr:hypothetical protein [Nitrospinota bacterium]
MAAQFESLKKHVLLTNMPFEIEEVRVMRELKIAKAKSLAEIPEKNIAAYIKKAIDTGYTLIEPKAIYRTYPLVKEEGQPPGFEESPRLFFGKKLAETLNNCDYATVLMTTIGPGIPDRADELIKSEPTDGFYLEHVGGWMADYFAERVDERIQVEMKKNGYIGTFRYAPGYGDWSLDAQPEMMRLTQGERIGVHLTETNIMIPRKSVSAVIGWQPRE